MANKLYDAKMRHRKKITDPSKVSDIIPTVYQSAYNLSQLEENQSIDFNTGFSELDKLITGLNRSDLIVIGARPAMGKTSFALNIARNVAVCAKKKVLFFSLELSREQLTQRILSTEARIQSTKFTTGRFTTEELQLISRASVFLSDAELYFDDTANITVSEIKAKVRRLKDVDFIIIDYLQLMSPFKSTDNRALDMAEITLSLKKMAEELNIPVFVCTQLSRSIEKKGRSPKPLLSDLRDIGSIVQDADIVLMLYREGYYKEGISSEVETAELIISKNKHGPTGTVALSWHLDYMLFTARE